LLPRLSAVAVRNPMGRPVGGGCTGEDADDGVVLPVDGEWDLPSFADDEAAVVVEPGGW
jgi:hypothetical protein